MKKLIILLLSLFMFSVNAQTSVDIVKEVNKDVYSGLTKPERTDDFSLDDMKSKAELFRNEITDFFNSSTTNEKTNKEIVDLNNEIVKLNNENARLLNKIADLEYKLNKVNEEVNPLKVRYNICSKIIYYTYVYHYKPNELTEFFTKDEIKLCKKMMNEWRRKYE